MTLDQGFEQLKALARTEVARSREAGRHAAAEGLNQTVRRLRRANTESDLVAILVNTDVTHGRRLACLGFESESARFLAVRGAQGVTDSFPIHGAPALVSAVETLDTVVAAASPKELGETLFHAMEASELSEPRVYLIPVIAEGAVRFVLAAAEEVQSASLELLCDAAGMRLEAVAMGSLPRTEAEPTPELVQIAGVPVSSLKAAPLHWGELPAAEQSRHLRAQRFAQVAVARMRVERSQAVREGQSGADLYSTLRPEIDTARQEYRKQFLTGESKSMVDYLYLELVRRLANDEDRLLGAGFPGRLI